MFLMSHTLAIRLQDELAEWVETTAKAMGVSQGRLIREQLERARREDVQSRRHLRLAGSRSPGAGSLDKERIFAFVTGVDSPAPTMMRATGTVPVHVLSGFLGSGKTTLLNRLLAALPAGTKPAVVVNDFGSVPVDGALVDRGNYAVAELASGCVCCTPERTDAGCAGRVAGG